MALRSRAAGGLCVVYKTNEHLECILQTISTHQQDLCSPPVPGRHFHPLASRLGQRVRHFPDDAQRPERDRVVCLGKWIA